MKNEHKTKIKYPFSNQLIFALVMEDEQLCKELLERIFQGQRRPGCQKPEKRRRIHFSQPKLHNLYLPVRPIRQR